MGVYLPDIKLPTDTEGTMVIKIKPGEETANIQWYAFVGCASADVEEVSDNIGTEWRKQGEWDMFELITSVYFGKQYYFPEEDGTVYSRQSHKHLTREKAIQEFLDIIGE